MGFIVDMGNIVSSFFLKGKIVSDLSNIWDMAWNYIKQSGQALTTLGDFVTVVGTMLGILIYGLVILVFYAFATFIYFVIMLLFFFRVIILWILAILAPFAFACYILPTTRRFWNDWWQNLIQWSIIGAPIGLFLYLSTWIMQNLSFGNAPSIATPTLTGMSGASAVFDPIINLILSLLAPFLGLAFLGFGALLSIKLAPSGASGIIKFGKSAPGRLAQTRVGQKVMGGLASGTRQMLAGTDKQMKRLEDRVGKLPGGKLLKPVTALGTRPVGWATRGISRLAGPALIQYAAEREKLHLPPDFKKWTPEKQAAWMDTKRLDQNDTLVAGAEMGEHLEYAPETAKKVQAARDAIMAKVDPKNYTNADQKALAYMDEVKTISKTSPELTEEIRTKMKVVGKQGDSRKTALKEIQDDIKDTAEFIRKNLSDDDLTIQTGLKLKYIKQQDVDAAKTEGEKKALAKKVTTDARYRPEQKEQFLRDTAAGATYVREFKAGDIAKIADTKTLSTRIGLILGNPNNIQRVLDEHGREALSDLVEGPGGLNSATNTPEKWDRFYDKNRSAQAFFTIPALRHIDLEGRKQMIGPDGKPTDNIESYKRRRRIEEVLDRSTKSIPGFGTFYNEIRKIEEDIGKKEEIKGASEMERRRADLEGRRADAAIAKKEIDRLNKEISLYKVERGEKISKMHVDFKEPWQEIERLKKRSGKTK